MDKLSTFHIKQIHCSKDSASVYLALQEKDMDLIKMWRDSSKGNEDVPNSQITRLGVEPTRKEQLSEDVQQLTWFYRYNYVCIYIIIYIYRLTNNKNMQLWLCWWWQWWWLMLMMLMMIINVWIDPWCSSNKYNAFSGMTWPTENQYEVPHIQCVFPNWHDSITWMI